MNIPDYEVSLGDNRPFKIRIFGVIFIIENIQYTFPPEGSSIDGAILKYDYGIVDGVLDDDVSESKIKMCLNHIISGELHDFING